MSLPRDDAARDLGLFLEALGPLREQAVLAGAFAVMLYRSLPEATALDTEPLRTMDHDWVLPRSLLPPGTADLEARIEAAGFVTVLSRGSQPPKQYFQHRRHGTRTLADVYGEILTPRRGREESGPVELCPGISAMALPYLSLLLEDPILLVCPPENAVGLPPGSRVRLPQPLWFVMQKILMRRSASPKQGDKRDKDFAAVYEVVRLFSGEWESWASRLRNALEEAPMPAKWFRDFERRARESFGSAEARGCLGVARIHERSPRLPEFEETTVAAVMAKLFRTLWPFPA